MKHFMLIGLLISAGIIASATGLKCYECVYVSGVADAKCQDENINDATELLLDCPDTNNACMKSYAEASGIISITRRCAAVAEDTELTCTDTGVIGSTGSICYCNTDACNGATPDNASTPAPGNGTNVATSLKVTSALFLAIPAHLATFYL